MSASDPLFTWFAAQGWQPLAHQLEVYAAQDAGLARRLWDVSVEMTGIDPGLAPA